VEDAAMAHADGGFATGEGLRPHAYFPDSQPELFDGVLGRRVVAFLVDAAIILAMTFAGWLLLGVLGILTFGLAWLLIGLVFPVVALGYTGLTLGGPASATVGMRIAGLQMRTWYGAPMYFVLAVVHAVLFWVSISILTPFILLVGLFNERRRLLHDFLIGTVVVNRR
jgi:uncharacterized RDD family membrane protein YckC